MRRILGVLETVAPTAATVLITGETGTGKECLARALHDLSDRARGEFHGVNCGAIPESLTESALFGHERGAFTGAHGRHIGYFERANGGTLFLDEVDSLSPETQVRLLRVLQEGEYERVGGRQLLRSGARIVAASNAQLQTAINTGRFRSDLYYRLNVINIHIPALRARPEDIPVLIDHIMSKLNQRYGYRVTSLSEWAKRSLMHYHWPGNVRQLENVLERSYIFATGSRLDTVLFDEDHLNVSTPPTTNMAAATPQTSKEAALWKNRGKTALRAQERQALEVALAQHGGNVTQAATAMGYSRRAIYLKLRTHGIDPKAYRS
jgi:DNA-binding NtrC family response regulator